MSNKDTLKEQLMFTDAAIRELKIQREKLIEQDLPSKDVSDEIDQQMKKLMDLTLQYQKY